MGVNRRSGTSSCWAEGSGIISKLEGSEDGHWNFDGGWGGGGMKGAVGKHTKNIKKILSFP